MELSFPIVFLTDKFCSLEGLKELKLNNPHNRPHLIIQLVNKDFPGYYLCIPLTKDDDKFGKFKNASEDQPLYYHKININHLESYLKLRNLFIIKEEFIGKPFTNFNKPVHIQGEDAYLINKKANRIFSMIIHKKVGFIDLEEVIRKQEL